MVHSQYVWLSRAVRHLLKVLCAVCYFLLGRRMESPPGRSWERRVGDESL